MENPILPAFLILHHKPQLFYANPHSLLLDRKRKTSDYSSLDYKYVQSLHNIINHLQL